VEAKVIVVDVAFLGDTAPAAARAGRGLDVQLESSSRSSPSGSMWFARQRPRVPNCRRRWATSPRAEDPREHTPLSGGQVDDTPFGGGAGMVLRVDVMEARCAASTASTRSTCAGSGASSR
jgi:hypothetical protein